MTLRHLLSAFSETPSVQMLLHQLDSGSQHIRLLDLPSSARPATIAALIGHANVPALIVSSRDDRADALRAAINEFLPTERQAVVWPAPDGLPYEQLPFDLTVSTRRVSLLNGLIGGNKSNPPTFVASVRGLSHLIMPPEELRARRRQLKVNDRLDAPAFVKWATTLGYQVTPLVQEPGTIARRGGIVDLFPPGAEDPIRIDLFGDEIETIRTFHPSSQRSDKRLRSVTLLPPSELPLWRLSEAAAAIRRLGLNGLRDEVRDEWVRMLDRMEAGGTPVSVDLFAPYLLTESATLLDYFPPTSLIVIDEPEAIRLAGRQLDDHAIELVAAFEANGELPRNLAQPYASLPPMIVQPDRGTIVELGESTVSTDIATTEIREIIEPPIYAGRLAQLTEDIGERLHNGWRIAIATDQVDRLTEIFEEQNIFPRRDKRRDLTEPLPLTEGTLDIVTSDLDGGWMVPESRLLVLSDLEIFGFRKQIRRGTRRSLADNMAFATSLTPGEFVVHIDHGIARFIDLTRRETSGVEREYLLLEYAKGDKLYVPIDQSDRVTRYSGGGLEPTPTKLGSGEWVRTKQRVRKAVREMAFELIQLYAVRESGSGIALGPDSAWDMELAESFPYTETVDQQQAIDDVKEDLETAKPMDRLVCGDVGFGKTEVALRAAFKVVNSGRQVAVLVPTTVLALQHYATFSQRLAPFPVRVEMLSRLRSPAEQREVLEGLKAGTVDIVIGTHRLVQKDINFKELGLIVIDEEQRFGVRHKEFLKQRRTEVDVLTMSATPIPRTLHMSLAGIRDISIIDTAPQARLPIRTFVTESSDHLLREVILREIDRGGQIYIVHNRVHSIDRLTHRLRELIPEARFGIGHGQMDEQVLEEVILGFIRHEFDVLVCTTIIESGIDIANVNTIIIDNADTLGLTQLYQLRGRVGRSTSRAYAYLLYKPHKALSQEAQARLEAIQEATELGAGMRVAMRDMEIRGAGNILGAEQSGHIAEIGFDLYIRLLSQAVEEVKLGRPMTEPISITLDLPLTALIPASYIADVELRLNTYRRIASVENRAALEAMREELEDRFGSLPDEVEHVFALIALRIRCADLGIDSMVEREREIVIRPVLTARINMRPLNQRLGVALKVTPNSLRLRLPDLQIPWLDAVDSLLDAVEIAEQRYKLTALSGDGNERTKHREPVGAGTQHDPTARGR